MLTALGASGQADARLLLHSVLAGGKRRITAEISQAPLGGSHGSLPMMQLNKVRQEEMRSIVPPLHL